MNDFGNYLYSLRKSKGYTQAQLAELLGITNKAVSKWETGEAFPETAQLVPLANIFGVTVDELLRGKSRPREETEAEEKEAEGIEISRIAVNATVKFQPEWWHKKFAVLIVCGTACILCGVLAMIIAGLVFESEGAQIIAVCILLALVGVGVNLFVYAGLTSQNDFLPVSDARWRAKSRAFRSQIMAGLSCVFAGVCAIIAGGWYEDTGVRAASVPLFCAGFALIAIGVFFFVYGGMMWEPYRKKIVQRMADEGAYDVVRALSEYDHEHETRTLAGRLSGCVMLLATILFLILGFVWNLWHPGWVVFPVGGILCAIVNLLFPDKKK